MIAEESSYQRTGSSKSNLLLCTTLCHSFWVLHNMWLNIWTLLWADKNHCFRWALGWCPAGVKGLTSLWPHIQVLPFCVFLVTTEVISASGLLICSPLFFFFLSPWSSFATASTSKLMGLLFLQVMLLSPAADYNLSVHVTNITASHTSRHCISFCTVNSQLCSLPI